MAVFKDKFTASWACKFRYKNWQGEVKQHKKTGFKTQKEAKEYEKAFLDKQQNSCDMTFQSLYEYYMEDCKARQRPNTIASKEGDFKNHILPFFGKLKVNEITPANIRQWQTTLISSELKASTLRLINIQLSSIFKFAIRIYGLSSNPCTIVGCLPRTKSSTQNFWTLEEFNTFYRSIEGDVKKEVVFLLLFYSGMRIGELLALSISDFDFTKNTVSITKNVSSAYGKPIIGLPKTPKGNRTIALPQTVINKVKEYYFQLYDKAPNALLFPFSDHSIRYWLEQGIEKAGIKRIRVHDLRHTAASIAITNGHSEAAIAQMLGHKSTAMVKHYAHLASKPVFDVANTLSEIIKF